MTELSGSGHDSSYYDERSDHERERHKEKKKKKKKKSEKDKDKHGNDEDRRRRKVGHLNRGMEPCTHLLISQRFYLPFTRLVFLTGGEAKKEGA